MAMDNHYDVIIIGTGAGGGTLVHNWRRRKANYPARTRRLLPREKDNWEARAVFVESKYRAKETLVRQATVSRFIPAFSYYVGGNTKVYGAALLRFRKEDFGEDQHHGGISPAWPLSYKDFEPYYTKAEYLYHVHGQRGSRSDRGSGQRALSYPAGEPRATHSGAVRLIHGGWPSPVSFAARHAARRSGRKGPAHQCLRTMCRLRWIPMPGQRQSRCSGNLRGSGLASTPMSNS